LKILARHTSNLLERKRKDKTLTDNIESHNKMLAITGHEMRNPLENFKFMLNMHQSLKDSFNHEDAEKMNELLQKQLNGMLELLNNLVQWGKLQLHPTAKQASTINLHHHVNRLLENLKAEAYLKGNKLFNYISPEANIKFDADAFDFIMRNLLTNANKFTENGSITIQSKIDANNRRCIQIKDTGIGMTKTEVEKLLNQTGKLSRFGTRSEKGSGLGIALIREFLFHHNSFLTIDSEPHKGTTVSFYE